MNKELNPNFTNEPTRTFTAILENRNTQDKNRFGYVRLLLREVRLNGRLMFREHMWIKESKHTKQLKKNELFQFTGKIEKYIDSANLKSYKVTVCRIRDIKSIYKLKNFSTISDDYLPRHIYNKRLNKVK